MSAYTLNQVTPDEHIRESFDDARSFRASDTTQGVGEDTDKNPASVSFLVMA
ncbi:MAG TPA: hypothetical protein VMM76_03765 [Pirellulaceae bacterium]|nr:hypothetical protein [Pirellulaceae bacterium]